MEAAAVLLRSASQDPDNDEDVGADDASETREEAERLREGIPTEWRGAATSFYQGRADGPVISPGSGSGSAHRCCEVDDITAPMLLIHGANDVRVARRHSDRIVDALRARGAEAEYLLNKAEGHWLINPDSNIELYRTIERFPARHLAGGP
ncbi:alpha/beta hydrolase family protein [Streptomyces sp. NPDC059255]|uniref:alpha/beta hydrolase family protein n=1 Tax=Streptomyces sp. NPDC059255 TaxID=3346793 RepID=UPI0036A7D17F